MEGAGPEVYRQSILEAVTWLLNVRRITGFRFEVQSGAFLLTTSLITHQEERQEKIMILSDKIRYHLTLLRTVPGHSFQLYNISTRHPSLCSLPLKPVSLFITQNETRQDFLGLLPSLLGRRNLRTSGHRQSES